MLTLDMKNWKSRYLLDTTSLLLDTIREAAEERADEHAYVLTQFENLTYVVDYLF